ncbi:uncharacterized protein [Periplaneta americana]|uniref:uncharacterized protein n=1 Tax=Periplaneta americana TaxID=6978 RepID=UPI0037E971C2
MHVTIKIMFIYEIVLLSLLMVGTNSQTSTSVPQTTPCRLWCQLPCTYPWQPVQYYCCDAQVKSGNCPPIRPMCPGPVGGSPPGGRSYEAPPVCNSDYNCAGSDKCCYDQCLMHYTCKPADP